MIDKVAKKGQFNNFAYRTRLSEYEIAVGGNTLVTITKSIDSPNFGGQTPQYWLVAFDAQTGKKRWSSQKNASLSKISFVGRPILHNDELIVASHKAGSTNVELRALSLADGSIRWMRPLGTALASVDQFARNTQVIPKPTMLRKDKTLYFLTNNGAILAFDLVDRKIEWVFKFEPPSGTGGNNNRVF